MDPWCHAVCVIVIVIVVEVSGCKYLVSLKLEMVLAMLYPPFVSNFCFLKYIMYRILSTLLLAKFIYRGINVNMLYICIMF